MNNKVKNGGNSSSDYLNQQNDFLEYDKENFVPDRILKEQEIKVKNYPSNLKEADMNGFDDIKVKEHLTEVWSSFNG